MTTKLSLAALGVAAALSATPASAALIQFSFADAAGDAGLLASDYSISGQLTIDTDVPLGTFVGGTQHNFASTALSAFSAVVKDSVGAIVATLGFDSAVTNGIQVWQGFNGGAFVAGDSNLGVKIFNKSGTNALTGLASNTSFNIAFVSRGAGSAGASGAPDYLAGQMFDNSNDLLNNNKLDATTGRSSFDIVNPLFGGTGITMTNFTPTKSSIVWNIDTISVADVSPSPVSPVPLPATMPSLFTALGFFAFLRRRRGSCQVG
jgi:hypothetical protein